MSAYLRSKCCWTFKNSKILQFLLQMPCRRHKKRLSTAQYCRHTVAAHKPCVSVINSELAHDIIMNMLLFPSCRCWLFVLFVGRRSCRLVSCGLIGECIRHFSVGYLFLLNLSYFCCLFCLC